MGCAYPGLSHEEEEQGVRPLHRARSPPWEGQALVDESFQQEGPVGRGAADVAHRGHEPGQPADHGQDLVARVDDLPRHGRAHHRRPRRPQARARVRLRGDGRPQARRVRADPDVPRPRRYRKAPMPPSTPGDPQKGKPAEDEQIEAEAAEAKQAAADEPEAPPPDAPAPNADDEPTPPMAEGTAADVTGVGREGPAAARAEGTSEPVDEVEADEPEAPADEPEPEADADEAAEPETEAAGAEVRAALAKTDEPEPDAADDEDEDDAADAPARRRRGRRGRRGRGGD